MRAYLEGLAIFGTTGLAIVIFIIFWYTTSLDVLTILALDYLFFNVFGLAIFLKINDFIHEIERKKRK